MTTTVFTAKGQIVIPSKIRKKFNIKQGTRVAIEEQGEGIYLKILTSEYFDKMAGILNTKGKLCRALLAERAKDKAKEG